MIGCWLLANERSGHCATLDWPMNDTRLANERSGLCATIDWPMNDTRLANEWRSLCATLDWSTTTLKPLSRIRMFQMLIFCAVLPASYRSAPANQDVTTHIPHEKPEELPPCFPHKLRRGNGAKDCWIPKKTFKITNGAR